MKTQITGPIDLSPYLSSPGFSVPEGIALARALCAGCPRGAPAYVKRAAAKLRRAADAAQTALSVRQRETNVLSDEDSRALDQELDAAWGGLRMTLMGLASLSLTRVARARRAADLLTLLFGSTGLTFLADTYPAQLTSMQALLQRIAEDKLDKEIDALCGPEFLTEIHELMPRYERMVNGILSRKSGSAENLTNHRGSLSRHVVAYATAVCSLADEDDQESLDTVLTALAPLDSQRATAANRRSSGDATAPVPAEPTQPSA